MELYLKTNSKYFLTLVDVLGINGIDYSWFNDKDIQLVCVEGPEIKKVEAIDDLINPLITNKFYEVRA